MDRGYFCWKIIPPAPMKIEITDHRKIYAVQKEFNELFPFLKIEFFAKPHTSGGPASNKLVTHSSKNLGSCRTVHAKGTIVITPNMTVRELKQIFTELYGLTIRVSRMVGNGWVDVADNDGWPLEEQNIEGQQSMTV